MASRPEPHVRFAVRSEEHTSELQSHVNLVCRLLLEKKKKSTSLASSIKASATFCRDTAHSAGASWPAHRCSLSESIAERRDLHSFPTRRSSDHHVRFAV